MINYLADLFWRRWTSEYLPELQRRQKWIYSSRELQSGDLVLIVDNSLPRNQWSMGRVVEGATGDKRSVSIKTSRGIITRPLSKVCMLEAVEGAMTNEKIAAPAAINEE